MLPSSPTRVIEMLIRQMWPIKQLGIFGLRSMARANLWPVSSSLIGNSLRVLMYHRVCDPEAPGFFGMKSIVTARPAQFAVQMDYISRHYNPVSIADCLDWIYERKPLPPRALLITFDDGYRDNLTNALPVLSQRNIPFALFIATGYLEDAHAYFWDWAAEAFRRSSVKCGEIPEIGVRGWQGGNSQAVAEEWVNRVIRFDQPARAAAVSRLSAFLEFEVSKPPAGTHLAWADLEQLVRKGCTIGAHTVNHAMMLNLSLAEARHELETCKAALEKALANPVLSFAFPYGRPGEYDTAFLPLLKDLGFKIAFRSTGAFNLGSEARANPYEIRRCGMGLNDTLADVAYCASGVPRLWQH
jgi:peptidoglycan/xylan/chitin deacetylase (PgdA/CDA1 family)